MTPLESLDKALRDFGDVVPEDVRDAALAVASDLAAERKRREGLEDDLHLERLAHTAAVTRTEQAEREWDEARNDAAAAFVAGRADVREEIERAEADNAALVVVLRGVEHVESRNPSEGMRYCPQCGECEAGHTEACVLGNALHGAFHTGAALLERMRTLEELLRRAVDDPGCMDEHWLENVVRALKETP